MIEDPRNHENQEKQPNQESQENKQGEQQQEEQQQRAFPEETQETQESQAIEKQEETTPPATEQPEEASAPSFSWEKEPEESNYPSLSWEKEPEESNPPSFSWEKEPEESTPSLSWEKEPEEPASSGFSTQQESSEEESYTSFSIQQQPGDPGTFSFSTESEEKPTKEETPLESSAIEPEEEKPTKEETPLESSAIEPEEEKPTKEETPLESSAMAPAASSPAPKELAQENVLTALQSISQAVNQLTEVCQSLNREVQKIQLSPYQGVQEPTQARQTSPAVAISQTSSEKEVDFTEISDEKAASILKDTYLKLKKEIGKVIIGQERVVDEVLISIFSRGHCLLTGVPGLAKTMLISTLAQAFSLSFSRIQFTPDLMPSDITGTEVIQEDKTTGKREFKFLKGPIFANVVLADEINRTPPKTQAALLEAMQEYQVTIGGEKYQLAQPFFVLATQNPIEQEGTYPLPEAQQDRFMFNIMIDYPSEEEEIEIMKLTTAGREIQIDKTISQEEILELQKIVRRVPISDFHIQYAMSFARYTRVTDPKAPDFFKENLSWGAGPRASQYLILGAKARALLNGRNFVSTEDIKAVAHPVLRHRIIPNYSAKQKGIDSDRIIDKLIDMIPEKEGAGDGRSQPIPKT